MNLKPAFNCNRAWIYRFTDENNKEITYWKVFEVSELKLTSDNSDRYQFNKNIIQIHNLLKKPPHALRFKKPEIAENFKTHFRLESVSQ